jgi:CheY-like chemotaxis protein
MLENPVEILLVEDNKDDAELTMRALNKNKLTNKIFVVSDGAEALDFIFARGAYKDRETSKFPKLVLLDLKLPKVGGIEVLRAIKSDEKTKAIPVVVLTSSQEERDITECYSIGVNSFVTKPVNFESFVEAIASLGLYWLLLNKNPF